MDKSAILTAITAAFRKEFQNGLESVKPTYSTVAMTVPSTTAVNTYAWLGKFPKMREWVGERQIGKMAKQAMALENKKFEATVSVERTDIEDDQVGMYRPMMAAMGESAAALPDDLVWGLLAKGKETLCYDGQNFFDTDHPVNSKNDGSGDNTPTANITTGSDTDVPSWYVIDDTKTLKPLVFQERTAPEFETKFDPSKSDKVFMEDVYLYGSRRRCNAGFGLWQLAHLAEKTALTRANLAKIIEKMLTLKADGGYVLGVKPSLLVVPPALEDTARELLEADKINGTTNTFKGRLKLHVCVHI
ncbi:Mu-like prophage major head subunit gpT family protein [Bergeriella denitrificans]|uniref:Putative GpT-like prophage major head subunit protein n=1 Tax=Bergeriella denitrificans TaxID=494 RepID=A0A378UIL6_BERDE|nr:Mu-like prophage major head subunit gpT family protein [Bergeriella denitrificans]STZ76331.1 putative GpT-like prophage major head subunit protein [Bergeriella denitrificans]